MYSHCRVGVDQRDFVCLAQQGAFMGVHCIHYRRPKYSTSKGHTHSLTRIRYTHSRFTPDFDSQRNRRVFYTHSHIV